MLMLLLPSVHMPAPGSWHPTCIQVLPPSVERINSLAKLSSVPPAKTILGLAGSAAIAVAKPHRGAQKSGVLRNWAQLAPLSVDFHTPRREVPCVTAA